MEVDGHALVDEDDAAFAGEDFEEVNDVGVVVGVELGGLEKAKGLEFTDDIFRKALLKLLELHFLKSDMSTWVKKDEYRV